jgi:hypothetical protein
VTPAPEPSCHKRARGEGVGGDSGRVEDVHRSPRLRFVAGDTGAEDPARPEVPADAVPHPVTSPEAGSTPVEETAPVEADLPPPPATDEAPAGNDAAICASPDSPSQESAREAAVGETEKAPVPALSNLELAPSVQATVPATGSRASAIADSLLLGLVSSSGEPSQGLLATRVPRSERGDGSPAPEVLTEGASSGKALVAAAESNIGSLSSASRLQQEWADTASSADVGEKLKVQGSKPTLAELDKQFTAAKGSLQNAGLQLLDAIQATNVSDAPLAPGSFCYTS